MFKTVAFRLTQVLLGLVAGLILSEFVVGIWFPPGAEDRYYAWQPRLAAVFKPDPAILPGTTTPSHFSISSQGIRGDEFSTAQTYRILAIGGSTTECLYLDDLKTWTHLLQVGLNAAVARNVWVGNVGKSGMDTRHHILYMQYLLPQLPRIDAVVMLVGVNDLWHFALDTTPEKTTEQVELSRAFWQTPPADPLNESFYKKTTLWHLGRLIRNAWDQRQQPVRGFAQDAEGRIFAELKERRRHAAEFTDDLPDLAPSLDLYARNLNTLVDLAQARSVRLIFVTQPSMWDPQVTQPDNDLLWSGARENLGDVNSPAGHPDRYYSVRALDRAMARYNDAVLDVCRARGVECVDLARIMPRNSTVFYDDVHFNENGASMVANILSDYLSRRAPFNP